MKNYGWGVQASIKHRYLCVVLDGWMLTIGKCTKTGRYKMWGYRNIWRKLRLNVPCFSFEKYNRERERRLAEHRANLGGRA
ncbi:hypothetical protein [Hydrogenophaga sp.]|uniref:hypothetical protein n=1 Tax=Hydrogenophaga sp. TaxID=1904254 RepID=UPI003F71CECD